MEEEFQLREEPEASMPGVYPDESVAEEKPEASRSKPMNSETLTLMVLPEESTFPPRISGFVKSWLELLSSWKAKLARALPARSVIPDSVELE